MRKLLGLLVVLLWSVGMVAQKSEEVRRLEAQRQKTLEEIERTSRLLGETTKSAKSSLERLNLISKQILSRKKVRSIASIAGAPPKTSSCSSSPPRVLASRCAVFVT